MIETSFGCFPLRKFTKKSKLSKKPFSAVSTHFSTLSSRKGRTRPDLALKHQNLLKFDRKFMQILDLKSKKCIFSRKKFLKKRRLKPTEKKLGVDLDPSCASKKKKIETKFLERKKNPEILKFAKSKFDEIT